jgi:PmbA protein
VVAQDEHGMQRDYWYDMARCHTDLLSANAIGDMAAKRALSRLGAREIATGRYPVVFDATVANSLIGHLLGGISGGNLYRKTSFLCDSLGSSVLSGIVHLSEDPHVIGGLSSANFDAEGVATQARTVVDAGVIQGYFLGSYSARKLGMKTTGNAGGSHNLHLRSTVATQSELLKQMGTGLLVTELMGQGVNMLTGDYSRGAAGFWVENGVIAYPVEEITIASNLKDMFKGIVGIGDDALKRSANHIGSILIDQMMVASQS